MTSLLVPPGSPTPTLGALPRRVLDELDAAVEAAYAAAGLAYRPRYTPVVRALAVSGPLPIRALADAARVTHSAASQTVAQMRAAGLVRVSVRVGPNADGRERRVALTPAAKALLPALGRQWAATNAAAAALEAELSASLTGVLLEAAAALERRPFAERIREAAGAHPPAQPPAPPPPSAAPARGSKRKVAIR